MSSGDLELSRPEPLGEGLTFLGSASHPAQLGQPHLLLTGPTYFPVAQMGKNLPTMRETQIQPLGQEDPLEKGIAIPWWLRR